MTTKGRYCVVIPAFNASATIRPLVHAIKGQGLDAMVIDDGSHDQTAALASSEGALVISHLRNVGKGRALRTGFEHALRAQYDGVITMDSDGQHDPSDIPQLIQEGERQHAGITLGNRLTSEGSMPVVRRFTNRLMSLIVSTLARQRIPDSQCGFRFIRKEVLSDVPLRSRCFEIETELLCRAAVRRWKIISVPIRTIYAQDQPSYIRPIRDALRFLSVVLRHALGRS